MTDIPLRLRSLVFTIRTLFLVAITALVVVPQASAQRQWNRWYFGSHSGLDFNGGTPSLVRGALRTLEGSASIADPTTGDLLFYTDGVTVWNRDHVPMPNGRGLAGHESSTQSALIVPDPGDAARYYIFTTDAYEDFIDIGARYDGVMFSIVDMTLDNGRGDVVQRNVRLQPDVASEKLCGVRRCSDGTYWVIVHQADSRLFYAHHVSAAGISAPVVSSAGSLHRSHSTVVGRRSDLPGYLKSSPDGSRLASVNGTGGPEVFNFDDATGIVTLRYTIADPSTSQYGVSFSPDNSKLYTLQNSIVGARLLQYDLTSDDPATIASTASVIAEYDAYGGALQLGPDGRIYITVFERTALDAIAMPNERGVNCTLVRNAIDTRGDRLGWGLPNIIDNDLGFRASISAGRDTVLCPGESVALAASGGQQYRWRSSPTLSCVDCPSPIATPMVTTTYVVDVRAAGGCWYTDSVVVTVHDQGGVDATVDRALCAGDTAQLSAGGGVRWMWSPSDGLSCTDCATPRAAPAVTTRYTVTSWSAGGCVASDTATVVVHPRAVVVAEGDTTVCVDAPVQLRARGAASYAWSPQEGLSCSDCPNPTLIAGATRTYHVVGTSPGGCVDIDSVTVRVAPVVSVIARVDTTHRVEIGQIVRVPVIVSNRSAIASEASLELLVSYAGQALKLTDVEQTQTISSGGTIEVIVDEPGTYHARITPGPAALNDTIVRLAFTGYLADDATSRIDIELVPTSRCISITSIDGRVTLDSLCGLSARLIEYVDPIILREARPNPFADESRITYSVEHAAHVRVRVFDANGRELRRPIDEPQSPGVYELALDASMLPPGILTLRIEVGDGAAERRIVRR